MREKKEAVCLPLICGLIEMHNPGGERMGLMRHLGPGARACACETDADQGKGTGPESIFEVIQ